MVSETLGGAELAASLARARELQYRPRPARWLSRPRALVVTHVARWLGRPLNHTIPATARTFSANACVSDCQSMCHPSSTSMAPSSLISPRHFCASCALGGSYSTLAPILELHAARVEASRAHGASSRFRADADDARTTEDKHKESSEYLHGRSSCLVPCRDPLFQDFGASDSAFDSAFAPRSSNLSTKQPKIHMVQAVSLDDYCADSGVLPNLVKIDAESAESQVLDGMSRLMTESPHTSPSRSVTRCRRGPLPAGNF